jgi:glucokinase
MTAQDIYAIGLDIGGTTIKAGLVAPGGEVRDPVVVPSHARKGPDAVLAQAAKTVLGISRAAAAGICAGVGVGIPGIVATADGLVRYPPNFSDWGDVDVTGRLRAATGMKVVTENDANCAALAEARFGGGARHWDFIFVMWGPGVGGGLILDRSIFRGPNGGAGEIGHVTIDRDGPVCNCGNRGCVESYIGQKYLSERARAAVEEEVAAGRTSAILAMAGGDPARIEPETLSMAAVEGDRTARAILREAGSMLGVALANVVNITDITTAVIGGGISAAPDFVLKAAADEMRSRVLRPHRGSIIVERALLGYHAGMIGAATLLF